MAGLPLSEVHYTPWASFLPMDGQGARYPLRWYAFSAAVALLLASVAYAATVTALEGPQWREDRFALTARQVYEFYGEESSGSPGAAKRVYFLGSSQVRDAVSGTLLEEALAGSPVGPVIVSNLAVAGDTPLRRLPELPLLLEAKPDLVVIGVGRISLRDLDEEATFILRGQLRPVAEYRPPIRGTPIADLVGEEFTDLLDPTPYTYLRDLWGKRGTIPSGLNKLLRDGEAYASTSVEDVTVTANGVRFRPLEDLRGNLKDPWQTLDLTPAQIKARENRTGDPPLDGYFRVAPTPGNPNERALALTLRMLKEHHIPVVVVYMPAHAWYQAAVDPGEEEQAHATFRRLTRDHDVPFIDLRDGFPERLFVDHLHLTSDGRRAFSELMVDVISRNLSG